MDTYGAFEDICTHEAEDSKKFLGAVVPPLFQNSLFTHKPGTASEYVYTRDNNPTTEIAEKKIAALEGAEKAVCFSSGMAAISSAILSCIDKDSHVICVGNAYSGTRCIIDGYMTRFGVKATFVPGDEPEEFEREIRPDTKLIVLESPSSLVFSLQDIRAVTKLAAQRGIKTMIDNTWAAPLFQNPVSMGVDIVVHSASKYLGGHSDIVGGVAAGNNELMTGLYKNERMLLGACMDPHQSWLLIRGLRTLPVRMKQHAENAMTIAKFLENHPKIERVIYPGLESHPQHELAKSQMRGFSGLMSFVLKDMSVSHVKKFLDNLKVFQFGQSWGGFESLAIPLKIKPYSKHLNDISKDGFIDIIRISVGLESIDTLRGALDDALNAI